MKKFKITYNSPAVLSFTLLSFFITLLGVFTNGKVTSDFFSLRHSPLNDPWTFVRMFTNVFGHYTMSSYVTNALFILLLGPILEDKLGTKKIIVVMILSTIISSVIFYFYLPSTTVCGANSIVFAFILLCAFTNFKKGSIPLAMILVLVLFVGHEIYQYIFITKNISNLIYIIGGTLGDITVLNFKRN